jgi:phosphatidylglycerol:prolipoprotein diacylglycerol transferase
LGSRILFIIVESHYYFVEEPWTEIPFLHFSIPTFLAVWKGGFVFFGGVIGAIIALFFFCRARKIPIAQMADFIAPATAVGHAIGRIGCLAGGCCYGYATYHLDQAGKVIVDVPFAISFPPGSIAYGTLYNQASGETLSLMEKIHGTLPLFPVQLLESFGETIIFFLLMLFIPYKRAHGQIALLYLILYSIMRGFTETFRGDTARGFVIENVLSTSQFISLVISIIALILMVALSYRNRHVRVH